MKVNKITVERGEFKKEFYLTENKLSDQKSDETLENELGNETGNLVYKDSDNGKFDNEKKEKIWKSKEDSDFDKKAFDSLVSMVSDFNCSRYTDSDSKEPYRRIEPFCRIIVDDMVFSLYEKGENDKYPGISSQNRYPFLLDSYQGNDLISKIDDFLGISKKEK